VRAYIPKKGDFIAVTFEPQAGHEQKGRRPALVVSNTLFNEQTGLALVCPLTTTDTGYPFHIGVADSLNVRGFVMAEQVKSIDYRARHAKLIGQAADYLLDEVLSILDAIIY
jgi:mRNA interferase MazF